MYVNCTKAYINYPPVVYIGLGCTPVLCMHREAFGFNRRSLVEEDRSSLVTDCPQTLGLSVRHHGSVNIEFLRLQCENATQKPSMRIRLISAVLYIAVQQLTSELTHKVSLPRNIHRVIAQLT
jgi:hypothetical protein